MVRLADLIRPAGVRAGAEADVPVYSVTKHRGFVPSLEYFNKQIFGKDLQKYKLVEASQFAYATIHLDEGSIGIAPERALVSPMYTVFEADRDRVDITYLLRYLKSPQALAQYPRLGNGTAERRKSISLDALGRLPVPLPPLLEQRRIAAILDQADALRRTRQESIDALDALAGTIFEATFGAPELQGPRIDDLIHAAQYGTSSKAGSSGEFPILRMGNVTPGGMLDFSDLKYIDVPERDQARYLVREGDVLFNRTNSAELVGKTAQYTEAQPMAYAGYLVRLRPYSQADGAFIAGYLNSRHGKATLRNMAKSIVGMANINAREARGIRLPHSTAALRARYASKVAEIRSRRALLGASAAEFEALFASLQHRAFRGEL